MIGDILYNDYVTRTSELVKRCKDKKPEDLELNDLIIMITYVDPDKIGDNLANNPYARELCRIAGNLNKFVGATNSKERIKAFDNAAASFGRRFY